ncbi:hypothetical protein DPMN_058313 [Dreissena polymorpha]|uniref:Uncharacterized protein n=1 Tax=Dreissena polymorpha TaxID=45954 RepID=A0A9D4C1I3_DREPO|nr:hypothetical protein DPMN_058313 [Dreissena polymorpha]
MTSTVKTYPTTGVSIVVCQMMPVESFKFDRDFIKTKFLTKFQEDQTINVVSRVFRNKYDGQRPVTKAHLSNQPLKPLYTECDWSVLMKFEQDKLLSNLRNIFAHLRGTNILFHDDWAKHVTSRVFTSFFYYINIKKNYPPPRPPGSHKTNVLTKFHKNWAENVTSRVFTCVHYIHKEKNALPTGGHVFHRSGPFSNSSEISIKPMFCPSFMMIGQKLTSSVFTRKTAPPTCGHVFQRTRTTFELNQHIIKTNILTNFHLHRDIIGTNLLIKFHEDRTKNVASRVFTRYFYSHIRKTAPPTGGHVFKQTRTTFELNKHIIKTNILTNLELDRDIIGTKFLTKTTARPPGNHVFQQTGTILKLNSHIKERNVLNKFHENWAKNRKMPAHWRPCFSLIWTIFELVQEINEPNVLTNIHDDWAKIVTSRVFTRKTTPPTGGHVFQRTRTTFELNQHIIKTNILTNFEPDQYFIGTKLLTKFHKDRTINVASITNKCGRTDGWTTDKDWSQKLT